MDATHRRVEYLLPVDFISKEDVLTQEFMDQFVSFSPGFAGKTRPTDETLVYLYSLKKLMPHATAHDAN